MVEFSGIHLARGKRWIGFVLGLVYASSINPSFETDVQPLIETSCKVCHNSLVETPLNFENLGHDLKDPGTFRAWVKIHDRISNGEMPPAGMPLPSPAVVDAAMTSLKTALIDANLSARNGQRVPLRRLTRLEYAYTLSDLLGIDERYAKQLSKLLPAEPDTGDFDTVASQQGISSLHVTSYLRAADDALDMAIQLGLRPPSEPHIIDYSASPYLAFAAYAKRLGFGIIKRLPDAYVAFFDTGSTYMFHSQTEGYTVPFPGRYRIVLEVYPYQAKSPVTLTVYRGQTRGGGAASLDELIGSFDLEEPRTVELVEFLMPGDLVGPSIADLNPPPGPFVDYFHPERNVEHYKGEGIAMKSLTFEGPLYDQWPPRSTRDILAGIAFSESGEVQLTKSRYEHVLDIVNRFAERAFRRDLNEGEAEVYAALAQPVLEEGRTFLEAIRVPLRAILSSPDFLFHNSEFEDEQEFALATRLSYFLWRSLPDQELLALARQSKLSEPDILRTQIERMLHDPKSTRFIADFAGQAFRLYELTATTPDRSLYPEYDDRLGQAFKAETLMYLQDLVQDNRSVDHLVDSDYTYLNRRLAEHYGIPGVKGQYMRRVTLPENSPRGGLLTHGSVHKVTANGTVTSPVPRGNFVLNNILGQPVPPPPVGVAGLEPDTRGTTTVRELLEAHRSDSVCASCHLSIDPPGFALEPFDPIGGFRSLYRVTGDSLVYNGVSYPGPYRAGPKVDASGITPDGREFDGFDEYKEILKQDTDQIARHMVSQLLTFSTGAKIEFADRSSVEEILGTMSVERYPFRTMIHKVVQSDLFASP